MGGLGISSVPHLTITSPLINRLCSSRWNYRRCQSPNKGCRLALANKLIIREPRLSQVKLTTEPATSSTPIQMLFVFPGLYLHDNRPERPITSWLARNLTWPTAGKYHSKPFLPTKPLSVSLPAGACKLQVANQSSHLYQRWPGKHWGYGWPRYSNPGPLQ